MAELGTKTCSVHFFELVTIPGESRVRGVDWRAALKALATTNVRYECDHNGASVDGLVHSVEDRACLALAVGRPVTPRQRNIETAERAEMNTRGEEWEPIEESYVVLFGNNILGMIRASNSAPSHVALAKWLNKFAPPTGAQKNELWFCKPIIDPEKYREILEARDATSVAFAVKPENVHSGDDLISSLIGEAFRYTQGVRIEVKVAAKRGKAHQANRDRILDVARAAAERQASGQMEFDKAKATIHKVDQAKVETIDLLEHKLAMEVVVPIVDDNQGRALSVTAAFSEIKRAYGEMRDEIKDALGLQ